MGTLAGAVHNLVIAMVRLVLMGVRNVVDCSMFDAGCSRFRLDLGAGVVCGRVVGRVASVAVLGMLLLFLLVQVWVTGRGIPVSMSIHHLPGSPPRHHYPEPDLDSHGSRSCNEENCLSSDQRAHAVRWLHGAYRDDPWTRGKPENCPGRVANRVSNPEGLSCLLGSCGDDERE